MSIKRSGKYRSFRYHQQLLSGEVAATLWQVWQLQLIALTILDSMLSNGLGSSLSNTQT
jgi:hypothetical protein